MAEYGSAKKLVDNYYHPWEKKENPQAYTETPFVYVSPEPKRHVLGIVGGNDVSLIRGNRVDLESDLLGITRPNTWCPAREHLPSSDMDHTILRTNPKIVLKVDTRPANLPDYQMWAYPATFAPLPLNKDTCQQPQKY